MGTSGIRAAELDRAVTSEVRVRSFRHDGPRRWWPAGAHHELEVAWVRERAVAYRVGRREVEVAQGRMMVLPGGIEHATGMEQGLRAGSVWLGAETVGQVAAAMGYGPSPDPMILPASDRLLALGELMQQEARRVDAGAVLAVEALSEAFAVELLRCGGAEERRPRARDRRITAAIEHIHDCYADPLGVEDMARAAGMSRYHFSRMFREQVGVSPYRFLQDTRVERAAELLRGGRRSVTEVAMTVGFRDLGRFGRAFRRRFGCAPSEVATRAARFAQRSARSA